MKRGVIEREINVKKEIDRTRLSKKSRKTEDVGGKKREYGK